jgi:hypothetical protein
MPIVEPKLRKLIRESTAHIALPPQRKKELTERDYLDKLYRRLIPFVYDFPNEPLERLVNHLAVRLNHLEQQYLMRKLNRVRQKRDVVVVTLGKDEILLPRSPDFDPREVPLVGLWCDGGFYTPKEVRHQNPLKLRGLGLADGTTAYVSYRAVIFAPSIGHPAWKTEPYPVKEVTSSFNAEARAVQEGLEAVIARLDHERTLPVTSDFHLVVHSDCQSLVNKLIQPPQEAEPAQIGAIRQLSRSLAGLHLVWQPRRRIKAYLGH